MTVFSSATSAIVEALDMAFTNYGCVQFGPGYLVYFGLDGPKIVILLCGGDKSTQKRDIATAHTYWKESRQDAN